ncbi:MAG: hypothetical protein ACOC0V_03900 [Oceanicaulis sp.]
MIDRTPDAAPQGPRLSEVADAAGVGIDRVIVRTMLDTITRPARAYQATLERAPTHLSQLKLFFGVSGTMLALSALFGAPLTLTLEYLVPPEQIDAAYATVRAAGLEPDAVNDRIATVMDIAIWPIMLVSTLIFVLILKLNRPSKSWWEHALLYVTATNGSTIVMIPGSAFALVSLDAYMGAQMAAIVFFFVQLVRLGRSVLGLGALRLILLSASMLIALIPSGLIVGALQVLTAAIVLGTFDLSLFELYGAPPPAPAG